MKANQNVANTQAEVVYLYMDIPKQKEPYFRFLSFTPQRQLGEKSTQAPTVLGISDKSVPHIPVSLS